MRIALVGIDDDLIRLAAQAARDGHTVVQAYDVGKFLPALLAVAPHVVVGESWESLLLDDAADVVCFGTGDTELDSQEPVIPADLRGEQLRRFVQEGMPVVVAPLACNLDQGYELEMYRREQHGIITTWLADWQHAGYRWLHVFLQANEKSTDAASIGAIQQIRWEVFLPERSRWQVQRRLLNDLAHIRHWLGAIETVLATGAAGHTHYDPFAPKAGPPALDQLTVHLGTRSSRTAIWSVVPSGGTLAGRITLLGSKGQAILSVGKGDETWSGECITNGTTDKVELASGQIDWNELAKSAVDEQASRDYPAWLDSCRDLEVIEVLDRSLIRGRTVAVHADEATESDSFKGVMASGGCIVLLLVLGALFTVVMVEGLQLPLRQWTVWRLWPVALVASIAFFLALQTLMVLVGQKKRQQDAEEPSNDVAAEEQREA